MGVNLSARDLSFVLDAVCRINTASDIASFARISFSTLCAVVPCIECVLTVLEDDCGIPRISSIHVWGGKTAYTEQFEHGDFSHDYFLLRMGLKPNSYAVRDTDLMAESERLNLKIYREIYEPQGHYYTLRLTLIREERLIGQFSFFRTKEQGDFSDHSLDICDAFAPHLALKLETLMHLGAKGCGRGDVPLQARFGLTAREEEVALLAASGLTDEDIGRQLFISVSTVKKHLYNAYAKMGVSNRLQLKMAVSEGES